MYCLVENKNVVYIGKSDEPLRNRIATYLIPGKRQETNKRIKNILLGKTIDIFIITEDSLIKKKKLLKICENINKNYKKSKNKITINRCAEMVIIGYCFGYNFLNK